MKKINLITTFLFLLVIIPSTSRGQNFNTDQIIGEWIFDYDESLALMDPSAQQYFAQLDANNLAKVQEAYQNRKLSFEEGGIFIQEMTNGHSIKGNWSLENGFLSISNSSGNTILFKVKRLNEALLLIPRKSTNDRASMIFSQWYLNKIEE